MSVPGRGALLAPGNRPGVRYCDYGYQTTIDIWCPADGQGVLRARITGTPGQRSQVATIVGGEDEKVPVFAGIEEP
ncbi:hypothetical protein [Streptomyces sp. NPDC086023]|uniref:hypothetical protein n=1 Tax=Streptomyces sp. NPDC086023 TaxID=3365746 RepID=UPI0037D8FF7A